MDTLVKKKSYKGKIIVLFLCFFFLLYHYFFFPSHFKKYLQILVHENTNMQIEVDVKRASLLYGFQFANLNLHLKNSKKKLLSLSYLRFSTFLPSLLIGELNIRNLQVENAQFYLEKEKENWNWSTAFTTKKDIEKTEEEIEEEKETSSINLFLPFRIHAKIELKNLSYFMKIGSHFQLKTTGIDLYLALITDHFSKIPLTIDIINIFDTLVVSFLTQKSSYLDFKNQNERVYGHFDLDFLVLKENYKSEQGFYSSLGVDTKKVYLQNSKKKSQVIDFSLGYNLAYKALEDRLRIRNINLSYKKKPWLKLNAIINHITTANRSVQLDIQDSKMLLRELNPLLHLFSKKDAYSLDGELQISQLSLFGSLDKLKLQSEIKAKDLSFLFEKKEHNIPELEVKLNALMSLRHLLYKDKKSDMKKLAFGVFQNLKVPYFNLLHEKGFVQAKALVSPELGIELDMKVEDLDLGFFVPDYCSGLGFAKLKLNSSTNFTKMNYDVDLALHEFNYILSRSQSKKSNFNLRSIGQANLSQGLALNVEKISLENFNQRALAIFSLLSSAKFSLTKKNLNLKLKNTKLSLNMKRLYAKLPSLWQEKLKLLLIYLDKTPKIKISKFEFAKKLEHMKIDALANLNLSAIGLSNLNLIVKMDLNSEKIDFKKIEIKTLENSLVSRLDGFLEKKEKWEPHLNLSLNLDNKDFLKVYKNVFMQGGLKAKIKVDAKKVEANLQIKDMNIKYLGENCASINNKRCKSIYLKSISLEPTSIKHILGTSQRTRKDTFDTQIDFDRSLNQNIKYNFSIQEIHSSHSPKGEYRPHDQPWYFISHPRGAKGIEANIQYKDNILHIPELHIRHFNLRKKKDKYVWYKNGTLRGKNFSFDLYDLKPENMSLNLYFMIQDLDLAPFLPNSRSSYDGVISANIKSQIHSFGKDLLEKTKAFVSIYRISPEFGGFVTRILVPTPLVALLVRNTLEIPSIKVRMQEGLIYSYIQVQRGAIFPGALLSSATEEIKQERMPIAQFLKFSKKEVEKFSEIKKLESEK